MISDLHTHTNASDSNLSRSQLLYLAGLLGLDRIAITDHDTMYNSYRTADDLIEVITGCELSTVDGKTGRHVHLLCFEPTDRSGLERYFARMRYQRIQAGDLMVERANRLYPVVTADNVAPYRTPEGILFKQGIMSVLCEYGYARERLGEMYKQLFSSETGSCVVPIDYGDAVETAKMAKESGATVILAHPSVYHNVPIAFQLAKMGLIDGIEIEHPRNTDKDRDTLSRLCKKSGLLMTGGSDYHGSNNSLGMQMGKYLTDDETCTKIMLYSLRKQRSFET